MQVYGRVLHGLMVRTCTVCLIMVLLISHVVFADFIILKDGARLEGDIVGTNDKGIIVETKYGEICIAKSDLAGSRDETTYAPKEMYKYSEGTRFFTAGKRFIFKIGSIMCCGYFPSSYSNKKTYPMVVGIDEHADGEEYIKSWQEVADLFGYIVIAPIKKSGVWTDEDREPVMKIVSYMVSKFSVDRSRVYLTGIRSGMFCVPLARSYAGTFRNVSFVSFDEPELLSFISNLSVMSPPVFIIQENANKTTSLLVLLQQAQKIGVCIEVFWEPHIDYIKKDYCTKIVSFFEKNK